MEKYLTSEQVAEMLQVHQFTILKYLKKGILPGIKIGRMYRIKESEVEEFLGRISTSKKKDPPSPTEQIKKKKKAVPVVLTSKPKKQPKEDIELKIPPKDPEENYYLI